MGPHPNTKGFCVQWPTKLVVVPGWLFPVSGFGNAKRYWYVLPVGLSSATALLHQRAVSKP
jgi:hypothetical protein